MNKSKVNHRLAAVMTAGMLVGNGASAFATGSNATFQNVASNITFAAGGLPSLIETVAYVGGIGLGVAGVFKLKGHVDNPGQVPLKDGLVRLGAGGGLLALPYLTQSMMTSISGVAGAGSSFGQTGMFAPPTPYAGG